MSTELVVNPVETYLAKVSGDYVAAYNEIVAEQATKVLALTPASNAAARKAAYLKAIAKQDPKQIKSLKKTLSGFLELADGVLPVLDETGELTEEEAKDILVVVLEAKRIKEVAEAVYESSRLRVFSAITEDFAAAGEQFPESEPGYVEVPELAMKLTREGGKRKDPVLNEAGLRAAIGEELWTKVTREKVTYEFDPELFLQAARKKPELLETLRANLTPGKVGNINFHQRKLEEVNDTEE